MDEAHQADARGGQRYWLLASVGRSLILNELHHDSVTRLCRLEMPLTVQYACFHPEHAIVYVVCSDGGVSSAGDQHCLAQISYADGVLSPMRTPLALPYRPLHAAVLPRHNRLVIAYNRPAALTHHQMDAKGVVSDDFHQTEGPDVVGYFPHQVIQTPDTEGLLLTCRGDDATESSAENPGSLRLLRYTDQHVTCVQTIAPNDGYGFGPRNCAFRPDGHVLYAVLERQNKLVGFRYRQRFVDLEPRWTLSLLKSMDRVRRPQLGGAISIHPNGRYAYVVNRSHPVYDGQDNIGPCGENSVVVYELDADSGEPREIQRVEVDGLHARCMALSPDGAFLVVAPRQAGQCLGADGQAQKYVAGFAIYRIADDGHLRLSHREDITVGKEQLFWADFVPRELKSTFSPPIKREPTLLNTP